MYEDMIIQDLDLHGVFVLNQQDTEVLGLCLPGTVGEWLCQLSLPFIFSDRLRNNVKEVVMALCGNIDFQVDNKKFVGMPFAMSVIKQKISNCGSVYTV